jgi:S-adenosylmethionine decarboxylase
MESHSPTDDAPDTAYNRKYLPPAASGDGIDKEKKLKNCLNFKTEGKGIETRQAPRVIWPGHQSAPRGEGRKDHFVEENGTVYAGKHIILDLWGAHDLGNLALMEQTLRDCVAAARATLLHIHLHHFSSSGGISGVAVLAESHISVHTWPERGFAAFDIFMCGIAHPEATIPVIKTAFKPDSVEIREILRGK